MPTAQALSPLDQERYKRSILLQGVGEEGQLRLGNSSVLIVGLGGLGSPAAMYLAAAGIGRLGLVDADRVEISNLQRQVLHGDPDLGHFKTESARRCLLHLRRELTLDIHPLRLTRDNGPGIMAGYDFVIEASDNFETKFLVNDVCVAAGTPFSHGGLLGMFGQTMTVVPGQGPCYRCIFESVPEPGTYASTDEVGVLGTVAGAIGALQATEAVKALLGLGRLLTGRLLTLDALEMEMRTVELPPSPSCPICREHYPAAGKSLQPGT